MNEMMLCGLDFYQMTLNKFMAPYQFKVWSHACFFIQMFGVSKITDRYTDR